MRPEEYYRSLPVCNLLVVVSPVSNNYWQDLNHNREKFSVETDWSASLAMTIATRIWRKSRRTKWSTLYASILMEHDGVRMKLSKAPLLGNSWTYGPSLVILGKKSWNLMDTSSGDGSHAVQRKGAMFDRDFALRIVSWIWQINRWPLNLEQVYFYMVPTVVTVISCVMCCHERPRRPPVIPSPPPPPLSSRCIPQQRAFSVAFTHCLPPSHPFTSCA